MTKMKALQANYNTSAKAPGRDRLVLELAEQKPNMTLVKKLINDGVNLEAQHLGMTPLMWCAESNYPQIAKLLIAKGAKINAKDARGYTPLMISIENLAKKTFQVLMTAGAKTKLRNQRNDTAKRLASWNSTFFQEGLKNIKPAVKLTPALNSAAALERPIRIMKVITFKKPADVPSP